jgi:hypothetical protein
MINPFKSSSMTMIWWVSGAESHPYESDEFNGAPIRLRSGNAFSMVLLVDHFLRGLSLNPQQKALRQCLRASRFSILSLAVSYFHRGLPPNYRRRCSVSLLSSGWIRVVPLRHYHQANLLGYLSSFISTPSRLHIHQKKFF